MATFSTDKHVLPDPELATAWNAIKPGQRLGSISADDAFDAVLMVLLDENFDAFAIYEAERENVLAKLAAPGSKARNERGALSVRKFKAIGRLVWPR